MIGSLIDYASSNWGIYFNVVLWIGFGLLAWDVFAKRWPAMSGRYRTNGHITWSEASTDQKGKETALISYSYNIDNKLYNGTISWNNFNAHKLVEEYPKGKSVKVYYSPRKVSYSKVDMPPTYPRLLFDSFFYYLLLPVVMINLPSWFFWYIFTQA